jgi:methanogenic corrinoid protein MtbC1
MSHATDLLSPKQVARAIGVSESSLKRWCDQGLIETVRTAGGHRKMTTAEVLKFIREHNHPLVSREVLGLPPASEQAELGLARGKLRLTEALLRGDELLARQIVIDLYLAKHSLASIFDDVVAGAFHEIGDRWECQTAEVYQERRACEVMRKILFDLRRLQRTTGAAGLAIGGSVEGDHYSVASAMAEVVLREVDYQATGLGDSIPFSSLVRAIETSRPRIFWLSVAHVANDADFVSRFHELSAACQSTGAALVVGGRGVTTELRKELAYSTFCDTMRQLESFAIALRGPIPAASAQEQK